MGFSEFHGNADIVRRLRETLALDRFPHAVILAGPQGAGKYTLALMLARAMNCQGTGKSGDRVIHGPPHGEPGQVRTSGAAFETDGLPDFCGRCDNCRRIAEAADLDARFAEAVEAREGLRDADKRETRILIQTHPDVLVIPPDPPQMMIKVDQVRHVNETIRYKPAEARRRVFIFSTATFMKEAANALLKTLEEPPEFATIFLLARNPGELLPTIRSRSAVYTLNPLPAEELEQYLAKQRPEWSVRQRQLAARLSGGAVGRALALDLEQYVAARKDALVLLGTAARAGDHSDLFRTTETYRGGAEGKERTDQLVDTLYSLLKDLMALSEGAPELVRNTDIAAELKSLAAAVDFNWIARAAQQMGLVQSGLRRNLLRPLSLDAFALALER
jgi:DNA polymerase III subunit delta'